MDISELLSYGFYYYIRNVLDNGIDKHANYITHLYDNTSFEWDTNKTNLCVNNLGRYTV